MALVVQEDQFTSSPRCVRRLLPKRQAVRFEHLSYSIHVVRSEVKMQMVTSLHEGYRRVWTIGQFEVKELISSANARIEIRVAEFKRQTDLLGVKQMLASRSHVRSWGVIREISITVPRLALSRRIPCRRRR
jgi:hypothetical protein